MPLVDEMARFVTDASFDDLSEEALEQLKIRVLDSLGCAIGALEGEPIRMLREHLDDFDGAGHCTRIGGGRSSPDRTALYNGALVRYLDYNDSYLAKGETCHPSDNLGAVMAAAEYAGSDGRKLCEALAVAYQVQCRLSDVAPVRHKGFDHTTQGAYAVAAGVVRALGLDAGRAAHALAISGTAHNALRVTRTGSLSHWKGLAYPNTAFCGTHSAFLAMRGITGPPEVLEGNKGFMDAIAGQFTLDWSREDLERVTGTILKKYNAEIHSQSSIEGALELKHEHGIDPAAVEAIEIETFDVAYHIIGGGEEGEKTRVRTKEEADHSLPYMVAVALLDDQVLPAQYEPARIADEDVQALLRKVTVSPNDAHSEAFPAEMPSRVTIRLADGRSYRLEKRDYEGFHTRPMSWETVHDKFTRLAEPYTDESLREAITDTVADLENAAASDLTGLLAEVRAG